MSSGKNVSAVDRTNESVSALWRIDNVQLTGPNVRLNRLTLSVFPGVTAVLGASGAGKTSLLNLLVEFEYPTSGKISVGSFLGHPLRVGWVPQSYSLWPHLTVEEHLQIVSPQLLDRESLTQRLTEWDLNGVATSYPGQLSAGQQARLSILRALVSNANVLVMDEPFVNVDPVREYTYRKLIAAHLNGTGRSLIFASHNIEAVFHLAEFVICLSAGQVEYSGRLVDLYSCPAIRGHAEFLGPVNWFEWADLEDLVDNAIKCPAALRPEQVSLQPSDVSPWRVKAWQFLGSTAVATLRHQSHHRVQDVIYSPPTPLSIGQSIKLEVRTVGFAQYESLS